MAGEIKRAIIIGGGIGGLATAIALRRIGIEVAIYERAPAFGEVGAGLTLWANAIRALRELGLAEPVIARGARVQRGALLDRRGRALSSSATGELEKLFGEPTIAIHRARLHEVMLAAIPEDCVRPGETCAGFEQDANGVTARFESGHTDRADLLIGADGIQSVIRHQMLPHVKLRYSGYTAWRAVVTTDDEVALGTTSESWGCGSRFGRLAVSGNEVYWFATGNTEEGQKLRPAETKGSLLERFRGWHYPVEELLKATPAEAILHNDIYDIEPMPQWSCGRVTLLGDAAHPTTPNLGQGACQAIESSVVLARSLKGADNPAEALRRYEAERMPRTAWITEQSRQIGRLGQLENKFACALRNLAVRLTPDSVTRKRLIQAVGIS
ncbi:MAG TPA: FAD-dependent monooxygenase [Blastocatellia bacterium]|nr:FAD-dependent monooxygenase [Blastocatellia bacterium]